MAGGSLSILISTFLLNKHLNATDFGQYAIIFTAIAIVSSIGLLGTDHALFRYARIRNEKIEITKKSLAHTCMAGVIVTATLSTYTLLYTQNCWQTPIIITAACLNHFLYTLSRIQGRQFKAQTYANLWKLIFTLSLLALTSQKHLSLNSTLNALLFSLVISTFLQCIATPPKLSTLNNSKTQKGSYSGFFISALVLTLMGFLDRLLINEHFELEDIGIYFYYATIALMPFRFLSGYIAADRSIAYKEHSDIKKFKRDLFYCLLCATTLAAFITLGLAIANPILPAPVELNDLYLALIAGGITRIFYSVFSARVSLTSNPTDIRNEGILFALFCTTILIVTATIQIETLSTAAWIVCLLWILRILQYCFRLIKWH